ncbi:hypothetical protein D1P53_000954 [Cryptococcus gattii VGV]|nr:hypothetical protein D1P53_000954 [Cryptococcus gattii VGV]
MPPESFFSSFRRINQPYSRDTPIEARSITVEMKTRIPWKALIRCQCPRCPITGKVMQYRTWIDHTDSLPFEEPDHLPPQSPRSSHPSTTTHTLATDEPFGSHHLPTPAISSTHPSPSIEDDRIKLAIIEDRQVIRASVLEMTDLPEPQRQKILKLLDRPIEMSALKLRKNVKSVSKHLDIQPTPTVKPKCPTKECQAVPSLNREGNREGQQGRA